MGIFSTKKKHFVDTNVVRVIEDDLIPNPLTVALFEATLQNRSLMGSLQGQALQGRFRNFDRMYRYARDGDYYYGLPNAKVLGSSDGIAQAELTMEADTGREITSIDYIKFRPLNNHHAGWQHLIDVLAYDTDTNEIIGMSSEYPNQVYLDKMVAVHDTDDGLAPEYSSMGSWWTSANAGPTPERPAMIDNTTLQNLVNNQDIHVEAGATESVEIHFIWLDEGGDVQKDSFVLDLSSYDTDREYYQARYHYNDAGVSKVGYWTYDALNGTDVTLKNIFKPDYENPGTYFPFTIFRSNRLNRALPGDVGTPQYETSKKLLSYIDIDFQEMADSLHEDENIGTIDQAVLMMAVPITSENEVEIDYLYRYFTDLHDRLPAPAKKKPSLLRFAQDLPVPIDGGLAPEESYALQISDADFEMVLSFDSITRKLKAGSLGPVGTVTNTTTTLSTNSAVVPTLPEGVQSPTGRVIRKQLTPAVYEEVQVNNIQTRYNIAPGLGVEGGADDGRLLIPLDYNVVKQMPTLSIEVLYFRSLHFVFNSHVVQKVKWYQRGAFKALLVVVAVVITILTYGATWKATLAAAAAGGATAVALALINIIIDYVVQAIITQFVFTQVVELIGFDNAFWLAVAAAVAGAYTMFDSGKIVISSTAENLIKAANGLFQGVQGVLKKKFNEYQGDVEAFNLLASEKIEELEDAQALLDNDVNLNPFAFIGQEPLIIFGEPPEAYFNRTVHQGNVGAESLNIIQNFVENSLRLPSMQDSIGDSFYV